MRKVVMEDLFQASYREYARKNRVVAKGEELRVYMDHCRVWWTLGYAAAHVEFLRERRRRGATQ